jgi:hypothetical protein
MGLPKAYANNIGFPTLYRPVVADYGYSNLSYLVPALYMNCESSITLCMEKQGYDY